MLFIFSVTTQSFQRKERIFIYLDCYFFFSSSFRSIKKTLDSPNGFNGALFNEVEPLIGIMVNRDEQISFAFLFSSHCQIASGEIQLIEQTNSNFISALNSGLNVMIWFTFLRSISLKMNEPPFVYCQTPHPPTSLAPISLYFQCVCVTCDLERG